MDVTLSPVGGNSVTVTSPVVDGAPEMLLTTTV